MSDYLPDATRRFVELVGPPSDPMQRSMEAHADDESFPIVGPAVGGLLAAIARLGGARRVFEFGSGFGYSASWFARGMDADGEVVLTEVDAEELALAEENLDGGGYAPDFVYEHGDAIDVVERYDGPFDLVLVDHEKRRYAEGFERIRDKLAPGGVVVADNMMRGPFAFEDVLAGLEGEVAPDGAAAGVVDYLEHLRADPDFTAVALPLGSGLSLGVRRR